MREARLEEVGHMIRKGAWEELDIAKRWGKTGRAPATVKRVDADKGEGDEVPWQGRQGPRGCVLGHAPLGAGAYSGLRDGHNDEEGRTAEDVAHRRQEGPLEPEV